MKEEGEGQETAVRSQKTEVRREATEGGGRKAEGRREKAKGGRMVRGSAQSIWFDPTKSDPIRLGNNPRMARITRIVRAGLSGSIRLNPTRSDPNRVNPTV